MKDHISMKAIRAVGGAIGGGILVTIVAGLVFSMIDLDFRSVWPASALGALFGALLGIQFPKVAEALIEFIG